MIIVPYKSVRYTIVFIFILSISIISCTVSKPKTPTEPAVLRVPATFDYSPPSRVQIASTDIIIAMVKPTYVGKNPEYFIAPFNEMAARMGDDFDEILTAKGFTVRGPFGSRDEMVYNDKLNSSFILEIGIELNPLYNRKYNKVRHSPSFAELMANSSAPATYTYTMNGEVTLAGSLVIKAKSAQYGELLWTKSIALNASSFTYTGKANWRNIPTMADELNQDNVVYNTISSELEKLYVTALDLAWKQIDAAEMKTVAEQGKRADKRGS